MTTDIKNTNDSELIKVALESKEFDARIDEAVPHRIKINTELRKDMREIKDDFVDLILDTDERAHEILKRGNKTGDDDKQYIKDLRKAATKRFNIVRHIVHPNEGVTDPWHVNTLIEAFRLLVFANDSDGYSDYVTPLFEKLRDAGISISVNPDIAAENPRFNDKVKGMLQSIIKDIDTVQGEICQNADMIKKNIYMQVEDEIRKSKTNKKGISKSQFQKLVLAKANKQIQDSKRFENSRDKINKNEKNEIVSKSIVAEKVMTF